MKKLADKFAQATAGIKQERDAAVENFRVESKRRRRLLDELQMLKGSIRVICRIRPRLGAEVETEAEAIRLDATGRVSAASVSDSVGGKRGKMDHFHFSHTFGPKASQADVFTEVSSLVESALDGYHACIFAYGQTGSGKTHTMEGNSDQPGINVRAFEMLFEEIRKRSTHCEYGVRASMVEIYNEKLRDLLREPSDGPIGDSGRYAMDPVAAAAAADAALQIRSGKNGMEIDGAISQVRVNSGSFCVENLLIVRRGPTSTNTVFTIRKFLHMMRWLKFLLLGELIVRWPRQLAMNSPVARTVFCLLILSAQTAKPK